MRIVGIVSHGNGTGKTRLLTSIAERWPGRFAAVKFTTIFSDGKFCPKDVAKTCACTKLHEDYQVLSDAASLDVPERDTGRLIGAGLDPVLWCLARPGTHAQAWPHVRELLGEGVELLTEGNTAMGVVPADALVFIVNPAVPRAAWKPDWRELAQRSRVVVVNDAEEAIGRRRPASADERAASLAELQEAVPETPRVVARFEAPLADWSGPLLEAVLDGR